MIEELTEINWEKTKNQQLRCPSCSNPVLFIDQQPKNGLQKLWHCPMCGNNGYRIVDSTCLTEFLLGLGEDT